MQCEEARERLIDLATGHRMPGEAQVHQHLEMCEPCRLEYETATGTWSLLGEIPEEEPDGDAMQRRFDKAMDALPSFPEVRSRIPRWPAYAAAAALITVVGVTLLLWSNRERLAATEAELRETRELLTLALMQQPVASERIRGVSAAADLGDPRPQVVAALVETLHHDPNLNVRLACVRTLAAFHDRPAIRTGVEQALLREQSPLVALALISFVSESNDTAAVDELRVISQDSSRDAGVREAAAEGLKQLLDRGQL